MKSHRPAAALRRLLLLGALVLAMLEPAKSVRAAARSHLAEGGDLRAFIAAYRATLPPQDSNRFVQPQDGEVALIVAAARTALAGDFEAAASQLDPLGYDVVVYEDTSSGTGHLMLRERIPCGRCWGLYLFSGSPTARNVLVEVPHPIWDQYTEELGIDAYLRLDASAFLIAGAHRFTNGKPSDVSDMARNPSSLFEAMHEALGRVETQVLQYHGFSLANQPGYPNVVLSNGSAQPHRELYLLKTALEAQGETVGIYEGQNWKALGATSNPQAQYTRALGGRFYHMEYEHAIRSDPDRRSAVVEAALAALFQRDARLLQSASFD